MLQLTEGHHIFLDRAETWPAFRLFQCWKHLCREQNVEESQESASLVPSCSKNSAWEEFVGISMEWCSSVFLWGRVQVAFLRVLKGRLKDSVLSNFSKTAQEYSIPRLSLEKWLELLAKDQVKRGYVYWKQREQVKGQICSQKQRAEASLGWKERSFLAGLDFFLKLFLTSFWSHYRFTGRCKEMCRKSGAPFTQPSQC